MSRYPIVKRLRVYGRNKEECEEKLAVLIEMVKAEIEAEKAIQQQEAPSEMMMQ